MNKGRRQIRTACRSRALQKKSVLSNKRGDPKEKKDPESNSQNGVTNNDLEGALRLKCQIY